MDNQLNSLMMRVQGYEGAIATLPPSCSVECSFIVQADSEPAIHLSDYAIAWIATLKASLDVDLYILPIVPSHQ
jgi:hypothetical protein